MPQTDVEVRLKANVESLRSSFNGVNKELEAAGAKKIGIVGLDRMEEGAHKATRAVRESKEELSFFERASEKAKDKIADFGKEAVKVGIGFLGITSAFEALNKALEESSGLETARVRVRSLIGSAEEGNKVFEDLEEQSNKTSTSIGQMTEATATLISTGSKISAVSDQVGNLAKIAHITGTPLDNIADVFSRIQLKGEVSMRELFRVAQIAGAGVRDQVVAYGQLRAQVEQFAKSSDLAQKAEDLAFAAQQRHSNAIEDFGQKVGLAAAVYKAWQSDMARTSLATIPGFGGTAIRGLSSQFITRFKEGIKEISEQTGLSEAAIRELASQGVYSFGDLIAAAKEYRQTQQDLIKEAREQKALTLETSAENARLAVLAKIQATLTDTDRINKLYQEHAETFMGQIEALGHQVEVAFEKIGTPLIHLLEPLGKVLDTSKAVTASIIAFGGISFATGLVFSLNQAIQLFGTLAKAIKATTAAEIELKAVSELTGKGGVPTPAVPGGGRAPAAPVGGGLLTGILDIAINAARLVAPGLAIVGGSALATQNERRLAPRATEAQARVASEDYEHAKQSLERLVDQQTLYHNVTQAQIDQATKNVEATKKAYDALLSLAESANKAAEAEKLQPAGQVTEGPSAPFYGPGSPLADRQGAGFTALWHQRRRDTVAATTRATDLFRTIEPAPGTITENDLSQPGPHAGGYGRIAPRLPIRPEDVEARRRGEAPDQQAQSSAQSLKNIDKNTADTAQALKNGGASGGQS